jgi:hypothetical protein
MAMLTPLLVKERGSRLFIFARVDVNNRRGWLRPATRKSYDKGHDTSGGKDLRGNFEVSHQKSKYPSVTIPLRVTDPFLSKTTG